MLRYNSPYSVFLSFIFHYSCPCFLIHISLCHLNIFLSFFLYRFFRFPCALTNNSSSLLLFHYSFIYSFFPRLSFLCFLFLCFTQILYFPSISSFLSFFHSFFAFYSLSFFLLYSPRFLRYTFVFFFF